ncbi:ATP-binding cassette domain-containing protein [Terrilactibacillus sp. BCM23-1]|uniref:Carnitine transport ATP-binding protein OpuCA n=1 Tax=Terrilactibacillus tamarindi TaxID=2599694 RepID=A0A6N8CP16_9BACI|nr:ABC transporter ATP-binding protein [Terrilactibacillus tamarindi]MTT31330.1 ATP-binding cassette domain-containing protein [Terrilactibacillus tamarindi]
MIRFEKVTKVYPDGTQAVKEISLSIKKGEFFVFIGESGCGKTTTLKLINRLIDLTSGSIKINDKPILDYHIDELRWNIGYVLQQIALFPHLTVAENISVVPELKKWKKEKINQRIDELLEMVGLDPSVYRDRKPKELSGGEQQRVGVLRALAADPDIILMDEPFSALDPLSREKLQDDLLQLKNKIQKTIVFITHDMKEALKLGDRIGVMKSGQLIQVDSPEELLLNPKNDFVESILQTQREDTLLSKSLESILNQIDLEPIESKASLNEALIRSSDVLITEVLILLMENKEIYVERNGRLLGAFSQKGLKHYLTNRRRGDHDILSKRFS